MVFIVSNRHRNIRDKKTVLLLPENTVIYAYNQNQDILMYVPHLFFQHEQGVF